MTTPTVKIRLTTEEVTNLYFILEVARTELTSRTNRPGFQGHATELLKRLEDLEESLHASVKSFDYANPDGVNFYEIRRDIGSAVYYTEDPKTGKMTETTPAMYYYHMGKSDSIPAAIHYADKKRYIEICRKIGMSDLYPYDNKIYFFTNK